MKQWICTVLTLVMLLSAVAPLAASAEQAPVEITFWGAWAETAGPQQTIAEFNELYPDIKITYVQFTNNDEGNVKLDTSLLSGQNADVFYNYGDYRFAPRVENGMLLDITDYINRDGIDPAAEFGNFYTYQGRFYGLPASSVQMSVYINKTMLDEAGLPIPPEDWTVDDWAEYARKLTRGEGADKVYGTSDFHNDNNFWAVTVRGLLGDNYWYNEEGLTNFDHPAFLKVLKLKHQLEVEEQVQFPYTELNVSGMRAWDVLLQQKAAMIMSTNATARFLKDMETYPRDFEVVVTTTPRLSADQSVNYNEGLFPYGYLGIASGIAPEKREAAWTFLKWMSREGSHGLSWVGHVPTWSGNDRSNLLPGFFGEDYRNLKTDTDSFAKYVLNYDAVGYSDSIHVAYNTISTIMTEEMEKALYGEVTPEQAVANMKERGDKAIAAEG